MKTTPQPPRSLFGPVLNDVTTSLPTTLYFSSLHIRRVNKEGRMDEGPCKQGGPEQPGRNKWWHSSVRVKKEGMTLIHFLADEGVWSRNEVIIADDTTVQYRLALRKRHCRGHFIINCVFVCVYICLWRLCSYVFIVDWCTSVCALAISFWNHFVKMTSI